MLFRVDPASPAPIFEQLAASVRAELARGAAVPGQKLPAAREVADLLDVNIHTVLRAYQLLRDEGLVELRRGRGAVITAEAGTDAVAGALRIPDLVRRARELGVDADTLSALIRKEYR